MCIRDSARARNLHRCAQVVCDQYQGVFPSELDRLQALPGIGRSTAGAIVSLAMNGRAPILDGNVKRVLARYHAVEGWPGQRAVADELWHFAEDHTPELRVADYTQAIMDLGATCCTRSQPHCSACPLSAGCVAALNNRQADFPGRKPPKTTPTRDRWMAVVTRSPGEVLLQKRPASGIWCGQAHGGHGVQTEPLQVVSVNFYGGGDFPVCRAVSPDRVRPEFEMGESVLESGIVNTGLGGHSHRVLNPVFGCEFVFKLGWRPQTAPDP